MLNFTELVLKRESCRNFSGQAVSVEQIKKCIDTARLAPSACNSQPWHFYAAVSEGKRAEIAEATQKLGSNKFTEKAGGFIVIVEEPATLAAKLCNISQQKYAQMDVGIVTAHLCYAATEQGLSSCILGWFNEKKLAEAVGLKDEEKIRLVLAVGYAEKETVREKKRRSTDEILTFID